LVAGNPSVCAGTRVVLASLFGCIAGVMLRRLHYAGPNISSSMENVPDILIIVINAGPAA